MKKKYHIWFTVDPKKEYGVWLEVSFKTYNDLIKSLISEKYEITTEEIGLQTFIKADNCIVASVSERRF